MRSRLAMGLGTLAIALAACGGGEPAAAPSAPVPPRSPTALAGGSLGSIEHLTQDAAGAYICVLRRPDDLATLRASFTSGS